MGDDDKLDRTAARLMDDWRETNESWTQLIERIDAALRRAKAEGWRDAAQQVTRLMIQPKGILDGDTLLAIIDRLDARAAQIEEGE